MAKLLNPNNSKWRDSTNGYTGFANWFEKGARRKVSPAIRSESFKGKYKKYFSALCRRWRNLSTSEKASWSSFSAANPSTDRYGNSIDIGGFQWFVRLNTRLLQGENSLIISPPSNGIPSFSPLISCSQNVLSGNLVATLDVYPSGIERLFWSAKLNVLASQSKPVNTFRTQGFFTSSDANPFLLFNQSAIKENGLVQKFRFLPVDSFGRSPGLIYDDIIYATV